MGKLIEGKDYVISDGVLKIFEGVKYIPGNTFDFNRYICRVIFPSSLICIGESAFRGSKISGTLIIPSSVKYIMNYAFADCEIKKLVIGENVKYIGTSAFLYNCMTEVRNHSKELRLIADNAFSGNYYLNNFYYEDITRPFYIDESAFLQTGTNINNFDKNKISIIDIKATNGGENYNKLENRCDYSTTDKYIYENGVLKINEGVEVVGSFKNLVNCRKIILPDSVEIILPDAFINIYILEEVIFSNNILVIMDGAFLGCGLSETVKIPNSLCLIGQYAFPQDEKLDIYVPNNASIHITNVKQTPSLKYISYLNDYSFSEAKTKKIISISDLIEEDRLKLESLGLLPEIIRRNTDENKIATGKKSILIMDTIKKYILECDYNENIDLTNLKNMLDFKLVDISGIHDIINYLFERNQINTIYLLMSYGYDYTCNSMISRAVINNNVNLIDILLLLGVDINEIGPINTTPLSTACIFGNYDVAQHLIEKGAAINMVDKNNKRAIDYAIENNNENIINLINSYDGEKIESEKDLEEININLRLG